MNKLLKTAMIAGAVMATVSVGAATRTTTFGVSASVVSNCLVSATALAFGNYAPGQGDVDQTSSVSVRCTSGQSFNVGLNAGATVGATVTTRAMLNGTNQLAYGLYTNVARTTNWGNTVGTDTQTGTGAGFAAANAQAFTVHGRVPDSAANQAAPVGAYTDTVTVTVTY
jgi:spore coat protein U-like protein